MHRIFTTCPVLSRRLGAALILAALSAPAPALAVPTGPGLLRSESLPAPCDRVLDRADLSGLFGIRAVDAIWDSYYARYAQTCRHEAIWPGAEGDTTDTIAQTWRFWEPILAELLGRALLTGDALGPDIVARLSRGGPAAALGGGSGGGGVSFGGGGLSPGSLSLSGGGTEGTGPGPDAAPAPAVVPLPAPLAALVAALAGIALMRRRRRA